MHLTLDRIRVGRNSESETLHYTKTQHEEA